MSPEGEKALSGVWKLSDYLAGAYHAMSLTVVLVGVIIWAMSLEFRQHELENSYIILSRHVDDIDRIGSRAASERLAVVQQQLNTLDIRSLSMDTNLAARVLELEHATRKIDLIESKQNDVLKRLDEVEHALSIRPSR